MKIITAPGKTQVTATADDRSRVLPPDAASQEGPLMPSSTIASDVAGPGTTSSLLAGLRPARFLCTLVIACAMSAAIFGGAASGFAADIGGADTDLDDYDGYYPMRARGYANNIFELNGLDNVNLYNGNLALGIPIGPALDPGGGPTLQVALHYNSKIWANESRFTRPYDHSQPGGNGSGALLGTHYAGLGWSLEFGHIALSPEGFYYLVTPDGAQKRLFTCRLGDYLACYQSTGYFDDPTTYYTRDGSDIRAEYDSVIGSWKLYFPNGTIGTYSEKLENYLVDPLEVVGRDYARVRDGWYLTKLENRWGKRVTVSYQRHDYEDRYSGRPLEQLIPWVIREYLDDNVVGRTVVFDLDGFTSWPKPARIRAIRFLEGDTGVGDPSSYFLRYELRYNAVVDRLQIMGTTGSWSPTLHGPINAPTEGWESPAYTDTTYLLEELVISETMTEQAPENISYGFRYWTCVVPVPGGEPPWPDQPPCLENTSPDDKFQWWSGDISLTNQEHKGLLRRLELPSGGAVVYDYDRYNFGHHSYAGNAAQTCDIDGCGCDIMKFQCGWPADHQAPSENDCGPINSTSLGVSQREVFDIDGTSLELTTYMNSTSSGLFLLTSFDEGLGLTGEQGAPLPPRRDYFTSSSETEVTRYWVAQEGGDPLVAGMPPVRDDRSVYYFSNGTTVDDRDCDGSRDYGGVEVGWIDPVLKLPLEGALIAEQHFRGDSTAPERTTVTDYTVDHAGPWLVGGSGSGGVNFGTDFNRRPRSTITYFHDDQTAVIKRFEYETDACTDYASCEVSEIFANNRTAVETRLFFGPETLSGPENLFEQDLFFDLRGLDTAAFDRREQTAYWKGTEWIIGRPSETAVKEVSGATETVVARTTSEYDNATGAPTRSMVDGLGEAEDIVTRYEYHQEAGAYRHGRLMVKQTGLGTNLDAADWTARTPDLSTYYGHQLVVDSGGDLTFVERGWSLCHDDARCLSWSNADRPPGWTSKAEPLFERVLNLARRKPISAVDGNGNGVGLYEYDNLGRLTHVRPTAASSLAETWLEYPTPVHTEIFVEDQVTDDYSFLAELVATYDYDGIGRLARV
ncbi:MAG: hypothetical protein ACC682_16555, partial [Gemmatimonadota bacterium]